MTLYCGALAYQLLSLKSSQYNIFSVTQHTNCTVACLAVRTLSHKRNNFHEKFIKPEILMIYLLGLKHHFDSLCNVLFEIVAKLAEISELSLDTVVHVKYRVFLSYFKDTSVFSKGWG
jgi:hypothetical protein